MKYSIGPTGTFRASLDLRRFPFDRQTLIVRLQSCLYDSSTLTFAPDDPTPGFEHDDTIEELRVLVPIELFVDRVAMSPLR